MQLLLWQTAGCTYLRKSKDRLYWTENSYAELRKGILLKCSHCHCYVLHSYYVLRMLKWIVLAIICCEKTLSLLYYAPFYVLSNLPWMTNTVCSVTNKQMTSVDQLWKLRLEDHPSWVWFCQRFLPVKRELFLSTVASGTLRTVYCKTCACTMANVYFIVNLPC